MINKLIVDFNLNTLDNFLQEKNRSYKPDPVDYTYYFESNAVVMNNFSDIQKRGDADVDDFGSLAVITAESKSSLSERSGKKIQFEIAKKILKESQADAAIFVFYDDKGDFRFRVISMLVTKAVKGPLRALNDIPTSLALLKPTRLSNLR